MGPEACTVGVKGGGRCAGGDAVLQRPQHGLIIEAVCRHIGEDGRILPSCVEPDLMRDGGGEIVQLAVGGVPAQENLAFLSGRLRLNGALALLDDLRTDGSVAEAKDHRIAVNGIELQILGDGSGEIVVFPLFGEPAREGLAFHLRHQQILGTFSVSDFHLLIEVAVEIVGDGMIFSIGIFHHIDVDDLHGIHIADLDPPLAQILQGARVVVQVFAVKGIEVALGSPDSHPRTGHIEALAQVIGQLVGQAHDLQGVVGTILHHIELKFGGGGVVLARLGGSHDDHVPEARLGGGTLDLAVLGQVQTVGQGAAEQGIGHIRVGAFKLEIVFLAHHGVGELGRGDLRDGGFLGCGDGERFAVDGADILVVVRIGIELGHAAKLAATIGLLDGQLGTVGVMAAVTHPEIPDIALEIGVVNVRGAVVVAALQGCALVHLHGEAGVVEALVGEDDLRACGGHGDRQRCQQHHTKQKTDDSFHNDLSFSQSINLR